MKVLSDTKPEGWEDELAYLREQDKQLCEKELLSHALESFKCSLSWGKPPPARDVILWSEILLSE